MFVIIFNSAHLPAAVAFLGNTLREDFTILLWQLVNFVAPESG